MGRRWGKTVMGGSIALATAAHGGAAAWVVPNYRNGRPLWRWAENCCGQLRKAGLVDLNRSERMVQFINGGRLGVYSMDNEDSIRGESFDVVLLDEAARIPETAWTDAIQPTMADRNGRALLISTPRGRNWFWREWQRGQEAGSDVASFHAPSGDNPNPAIQHAAQQAQERVPERTYRQEWLAEFVDDAGGVFRGVRDAVETGRTQPLPPEPGRAYWLGVDLARIEDFTVLAVLDAEGRQAYFERFNQISWERQIEAICRAATRYNAQVVLDSTGVGDPIYEALRKRGLRITPFRFTSASKEPLIDNLALKIEQQQVKLMDVPTQTAELEAYEYEITASGNTRMNAPSGSHDDCVIALALAAWGLRSTARHGAFE